jgi:hypothetical protein
VVHSEFFWGNTKRAGNGGLGESFPPHPTKAKKHKNMAIGFIRLFLNNLKSTIYPLSLYLKDINARG